MSKLAEALVKAQKDLASVPHDAVNSYMKQSYTSAEKMIECCRKALHAHGISVVCVERVVTPESHMLRSVFRAMNAEEHIESKYDMAIEVSKGTPLDKAIAVASTFTLTYYLRDLLLAPRGESVEERDDNDAGGKKAGEKPPQEVAAAGKKFMSAIVKWTGIARTDKKFTPAANKIARWLNYGDVKNMTADELLAATDKLQAEIANGREWHEIETPI